MRVRATLFAATVVALTACDSSTDADVRFRADLTGAKEVPSVTTNGSGTFTGTLNDDNTLSYTLTYQNLSSNVTMAHIHGPASSTQTAGIIIDFAAGGRTLQTGVTSGTSSGTINLGLAATVAISGDSLRKLLDNGNAYVNVHTVNNGGGEIRGQITRQ